MAFENFLGFYYQMNPLLEDGDSPDAAQKLETAAALLEQAARQFPDERSELVMYRLRLAGRRQDVAGAVAILESALDQGICYSPEGMDYLLGAVYHAPEIQ